jgi:glycosyltransferase involved in cell wall biosynthesis
MGDACVEDGHSRFLVHAPNVRAGGGFVLLQEVLEAVSDSLHIAHLDGRIQGRLRPPVGAELYYVERSLRGRLRAEWRLWKKCRPDDIVLCFHGMPPLLPVRGNVIVFLQNRLLLGGQPLGAFPFRDALRIRLERLWCLLFRAHVDEYVVQTPSMARALAGWHGGKPRIRVLPFAADTMEGAAATNEAEYDFVYVAGGEGHKNHERLIEAWQLLADAGLFPSLALTVGGENHRLVERLRRLGSERPVRIHNLGTLAREQVLNLYRRANALIYPSTDESLGLPLLEAAAAGLPIVAAERDYVRDVVVPAETFDPESPVSIARAVRRFLGQPEAPLSVATAQAFVEQILRP